MITQIKPQEGFQERFCRSNVSIAWGGGSLGGGKTMALMLSIAPYLDNPNSSICFIRKTFGEIKTGGGILSEIKKIYEFDRITESKTPTITMESGARILLMQVANENRETFQEAWKGSQFSIFCLDELTGYEFETFTYLLTRNRSDAGYKALMRCTTNPKYSSWVRTWLQMAGYIGDDGYIKPEMDGAVRYFYVRDGRDVKSVIWGSTKEEVYLQHKDFFDDKAAKSRGRANWEDFILDFAFYRGDIWGNKIMLDKNPNYIASVASAGEITTGALLDGNWLVDPDMWVDLPITEKQVSGMFTNDPQDYGACSITADIALGGKDNLVVLAWKGRHCIDINVMEKCNASQALSAIRRFQTMYDVPDSRVVFDGVSIGEFIGGLYGMITGAVSFKAQAPAIGMGKHNYQNLKTQCADKLCTFVKQGNITISQNVANFVYKNQHMKSPKSVRDVIYDEFRVVRFEEIQSSGKIKLINKDAQKDILGGRSPDIIDNLIYQCYFHLDHTDAASAEYDERLMKYTNVNRESEDVLDYLDSGGWW